IVFNAGSIGGGASPRQTILTRRRERLARASATPSSRLSAAATFCTQAPQCMSGTERSFRRKPSPAGLLARLLSSAEGPASQQPSSAQGAQQLIRRLRDHSAS